MRNSNVQSAIPSLKILCAGKEYFETLCSVITNAEYSVYLQVYIFEEDQTGALVADALMNAANKGVKVFVLVDAYGSAGLSRGFRLRMMAAGVQFRFFQPLFKTKHFYIGRRLHHKLLVADARVCLVGGINIGDRYNGSPAAGPWLDFAVYAEGNIALQACMLARQTWEGFPSRSRQHDCYAGNNGFYHKTSDMRVWLVRNDWIYGKNEISRSYRHIFRHARLTVTVIASYFIPGKMIRKSLLSALKRGVAVRVIMAGPSDVMLAKYAERFMYDWLLRNGVEVYEYEKAVLHGKLAICDVTMATVGSYNVNNLSAYASVELNMNMEEPVVLEDISRLITCDILPACRRITAEEQEKSKTLWRRFVWWWSYQLVRIILFLFSFYVKPEYPVHKPNGHKHV